MNFDEITKEIKKNMLKELENGLLLSDTHIEILNRYGFDYRNFGSINELIYALEEYLNEEGTSDCDDLEWVSQELAERNYYANTNK